MTDQQKQIEAVREKIAEIIRDWTFGARITSSLVGRLLSLPEIAILDKDQSLPKYSPYPCEPGHIQRAQDDMLSEHFQKTLDKGGLK